jgi:hypothetical protein
MLACLLAYVCAAAGTPADAATALTPAQPQQQSAAGTATPGSSSSSSSAATACRAVQLIELLVRHQPDWLPACPAVFNALWQQWNLVGSQPVSRAVG